MSYTVLVINFETNRTHRLEQSFATAEDAIQAGNQEATFSMRGIIGFQVHDRAGKMVYDSRGGGSGV